MKNIKNIVSSFVRTHLAPSSIKSAAIGNTFTMGFRLESDNNWYADIARWPGSHAQLQMVAGADDFLDAVNADHNLGGYVTLEVSANSFEGSDHLVKTDQSNYGATYSIPSGAYGRQRLWLCNVSRWVFGHHPDKIYYKVVL